MMDQNEITIAIPSGHERNIFGEFDSHLKKIEHAGVKTTGIGSMFRLSYKVQLKNPAEEKAFIDELRTKNGNLEVALLPYTETQNQL